MNNKTTRLTQKKNLIPWFNNKIIVVKHYNHEEYNTTSTSILIRTDRSAVAKGTFANRHKPQIAGTFGDTKTSKKLYHTLPKVNIFNSSFS